MSTWNTQVRALFISRVSAQTAVQKVL